jgi:tetratricopeptide (TPR) repeat protein
MGTQVVVGVFVALLLFSVGKFWWADKDYAKGESETDVGFLERAVNLRGNEPLYRSELGYAAAAAAVSVSDKDATYAAELRDLADLETDKVLREHPSNVSLWRTAIRTYYQLSLIDPNFEDKTLKVFDEAIKRAPTDPKLYYNKALMLEISDKNDQALQNLEKAVSLKPNYIEAISALGDLYQKTSQLEKARNEFQTLTKLLPTNIDVAQKLKEIEASISAQPAQ